MLDGEIYIILVSTISLVVSTKFDRSLYGLGYVYIHDYAAGPLISEDQPVLMHK